MEIKEQVFQIGGQTIRAVLLRRSSRYRWNAFLWGPSLWFGNSFARKQAAERWLRELLRRYFPTLRWQSFPDNPKTRAPYRARRFLRREPVYRSSYS
jgi:hypothetical protein